MLAVVPAVAIGNVPQLAVDVLLSSLGGRLEAVLDSAHVVPVVGNAAFGDEVVDARDGAAAPAGQGAPGAPATALQSFRIVEDDVEAVLLQQRAPAVRGRSRQLAHELGEWARGAGVTRVLLLASADPRQRAQTDLGGTRWAFTSGARAAAAAEALGGAAAASAPAASSWIDAVAPAAGLAPLAAVDGTATAENPFGLEMAGSTNVLLRALTDAGLDVGVLLLFVSESDNVHEAVEMAARSTVCMGRKPEKVATIQWRLPVGWDKLHGPAPPPSLF